MVLSKCCERRHTNQEPETGVSKRCARHATRNSKQKFRNVATVVRVIKHAGKYVKKGNKTLRTKNESERMSVAMFHDVYVLSVWGETIILAWVRD